MFTHRAFPSNHHNRGFLGVCKPIKFAELDTGTDGDSTSMVVAWTSILFREFDVFETVYVDDQCSITS